MNSLIVAMHLYNYAAFKTREIIESTMMIFTVHNDGFANVGYQIMDRVLNTITTMIQILLQHTIALLMMHPILVQS